MLAWSHLQWFAGERCNGLLSLIGMPLPPVDILFWFMFRLNPQMLPLSSHRQISKFHMDWRWLEVHGDLVDEKGEEVGLIRLRRTTGNSVVSNLKVPGSTTWGNPNEAIGWWRDQWHPGAPTFHPEESPSVEPPNLSHSKLLSDGFCFQLEQKPGVCMSESFSSTRQVVARSLGWVGPRHSPFSRGSSSELLNQRWTASFFFGVNGLKQHVHLSQVELQGAGRL